MLYDERLADAYVETWRRIATRFSGHPALYGFDLVNEPKQVAFAPVSYWDIQRRHGARIYVGEFSAAAWAPGADAYLRDCISLFEEYGWAWTYHAFREWGPWSVEHQTAAPGRPSVPSADTPRKRALLGGFGLGSAPASAAP